MSDQDVTCGACGATTAATAVVCAACGALLAAYATPAGAGDGVAPEPPDPAAGHSTVTPVAASSPAPLPGDAPAAAARSAGFVTGAAEAAGQSAVKDPPPVTDPVGASRWAPPAEPRLTQAAATGEAPSASDAPTADPRAAQPEKALSASHDESAAPVFAIPAAPTETRAPERLMLPSSPESDAPRLEGPPGSVEHQWQRKSTTRWETHRQRHGQPAMARRQGQASPTGVPRLNRLDGWGPGQMLASGIGLLIGSCVFLSIGTSVQGAGCLVSFAIIGVVIGILMTVNAARTLFGVGE